MARSAARKRPEVGFELDLIPVLSLVVHLVPMLLLSVRFTALTEVNVKGPLLPTLPAPGPEAYEEQREKVVSVQITAQGFVVNGSGEADPRIPCKGICTPETYDYATLNRSMIAAKRLHPDETRVVIAPDPAIPFEILIGVMDATRATPDGQTPLFPAPLIASGKKP